MNSETRNLFAIFIATIVMIIGAAFLFSSNNGGGNGVFTNEALIGASTYATGSATPKVTIVEFSDFECPACVIAEADVDEVLRNYPDKVKFVYRNFPLAQHKLAQKAAEALEAAGAQGKYWEMHKAMFAAQGKIDISELMVIASQLGLNLNLFESDLSSGKYRSKVALDLSDGSKFGVTATPTFFVNGKRIVGGDVLLSTVDEAIRGN